MQAVHTPIRRLFLKNAGAQSWSLRMRPDYVYNNQHKLRRDKMNGRKAISILLCILWAATAVALDRIGKPKADLEQGQMSLGFDYSFSREDAEASGSDILLAFGESPVPVEDVESNRYYANIGYGLTDWIQPFMRIGTADTDFDDGEFNGNDQLAWGYGVKLTAYENENLSLGAVGQMSWINTDDAGVGWEADYDAYEIQIAAGPTLDMGGWLLYGGAFYYILEGDIDGRVLGIDADADIEEDSNWGGFIGAELPIIPGFALNVDYLMMDDAYAVGAGLVVKF
jgi:hypothetical protein